MDRTKAATLNEQQAVAAIRAAIANGLDPSTVVVLLLDAQDPTGGPMAKGLMPAQYAEAMAAVSPGHSAFLTTYIRRSDLERMASVMLVSLLSYIKSMPQPPAGSFLILCFSDDGAEQFVCEVPAAGKPGDA